MHTENYLSPYLVLDRGTFNRPLDEDRSGRGGICLPISSVIYIGASRLSALNVNNNALTNRELMKLDQQTSCMVIDHFHKKRRILIFLCIYVN